MSFTLMGRALGLQEILLLPEEGGGKGFNKVGISRIVSSSNRQEEIVTLEMVLL